MNNIESSNQFHYLNQDKKLDKYRRENRYENKPTNLGSIKEKIQKLEITRNKVESSNQFDYLSQEIMNKNSEIWSLTLIRRSTGLNCILSV